MKAPASTLRGWPPETTELGGKQIRKRQAVIAVMAAGNRDPERFPDPDRLDITAQRQSSPCLRMGSTLLFWRALARIEGQIAFETILRRFRNLALKPGPLTWRTNLGLRGLNALPITFDQSIANKN